MKPPFHYYTTLRGWERFLAGGTSILTYHKFGPAPRGARLKGMYLPAELFRRQLREFQDAGFANPDFDTVLDPAPEAGRRCFLTIDDGCENVLHNALPALQARGAKAILFLVAGLLGKRTEWQAGTGEVLERIMDAGQVREWLAGGQSIGAHTLTHPHLDRLPEDRAREEIAGSRKLLEDIFGVAVRHFCYPYGDHNDRVVGLVREAGFMTACTTHAGANPAGADPLRLLRITARYPSRKLRNLPLLAALWWRRMVHRQTPAPGR